MSSTPVECHAFREQNAFQSASVSMSPQTILSQLLWLIH
jgi:hypothetical protein